MPNKLKIVFFSWFTRTLIAKFSTIPSCDYHKANSRIKFSIVLTDAYILNLPKKNYAREL